MAFGRLGLSYSNFLDLTPRQLTNAIEGYFEGEEQKVRESWEQTRIIVGYLANQNAKHPKPFNKILPLPWDNNTKTTEADLDELRRHMEAENKKIRDGIKDSNTTNGSNIG